MGERRKGLKFWCLAAVIWGGLTHPLWAGCEPDKLMLRGPWGQAQFFVEIANDPDSRAQGLMYRETLARTAGMLFVYDTPAQLGFWMRNTLIPLDLLFVDERGRIIHIHHNAQPLDETVIYSNGLATAVLEINGGMAAQFGIGPGSDLQHESFDQTVAHWPCEAS